MQTSLKITARLVEGEVFRYEKDGKAAALCTLAEGRVQFSIGYSFHDDPLVLTGEAQPGDSVTLILLPWRIELWVNDRLVDEEWPFGEHALEDAVLTSAVPCEMVPYIPEAKTEPTVLGTFTGAEGWQPEPDVYVGDCMPYADGKRYHVLYLKDRHRHQSKWRRGAHQWSHISTDDLKNWQIHPMAVEIDDPAEGSICTGSWIAAGDREYLFYTVRTCDGTPASIRRSVSDDGYHYQKDRKFSVLLSEKYTGVSARDPKVIKGEDGLYHMFLTTSLAKEKKGCLVHLSSPDLTNWLEEADPIYISPTADEPECSDYFTVNGYYYLVYSLRGQGLYQFSRQPFTDWQIPADPVIPCKSVPKAAIWQNRILFAGFDGKGKYAGTMTFKEAHVQADGTLTYSDPQM